MSALEARPDSAVPSLLFEHPLNERTRTLLRLSHLFDQFEHSHRGDDPWQHRLALQALIELAAVLARNDLKSEFIKQIDQQSRSLNALATRPGVDQATLKRVLEDLAATRRRLQATPGQLGKPLRKHEFLKGLAQRMAIPGGSFEFDLPQLHLWLHRPLEERLAQLRAWRRELDLAADTVELLLGLLRNSSLEQPRQAEDGFYQHSLNPDRHEVELIQVRIDPALGLYAEISGNKHRFCIRFMEGLDLTSPVATRRRVPFQLKTCAL